MAAPRHAEVSFEGIEPGAERMEALYHVALQWFAKSGRAADFVTLRGAGHRATNARFKGPHAKLLKSGFAGLTDFELGVEGPTTHYDVNMMFSLAASCTHFGEPGASFALSASCDLGSLSADSMLVPALAAIHAGRPAYGTGSDGSGALAGAEVEAIFREINEWDYTSRNMLRPQAWRARLLPGLNRWNFLSERQLAVTLEGAPLADWIRARVDRGTLTPLSDGLSLWDVAPQDLSHVFVALWQNGVIFDARRHSDVVERVIAAAAPPAAPEFEVEPPKIDRTRRDALLKRLRPAFEYHAAADPVVRLEDFFDGNGDEYSFAPNAVDTGRPTLERCLRILRDIRARSDVQDVLVAVRRPLDLDGGTGRWPRSDTLFVVTKRDAAAVEAWAQALVPDEVTDLGASWSTDSIATPFSAPLLGAGARVHRLWWD